MKASVRPQQPAIDTRRRWVKFEEDQHDDELPQNAAILREVELLGESEVVLQTLQPHRSQGGAGDEEGVREKAAHTAPIRPDSSA